MFVQNRVKLLLVFMLMLLFVGGCASIQTVSSPKHRIGHAVELNELSTANVGDVIFSQFDYYSTEGAVMINSFSKAVGLGSVKVPAGEFLLEVRIDEKKAYCTEHLTYVDPLVGPYKTSCYFDTDDNKRFEKLWVAPGALPFTYDISPEIPYKITEIHTGSQGFKYELLYNGISGNVIHLSYREFIDNLIRPAFQQDITYTIKDEKPTVINFRGVKIEVLSVGNNEIQYRVLSGFNK